MLCIRQVKHLAAALQTSESRLREVADNPEEFCEELMLLDPAKPAKPRPVLDVRGELRQFQNRLLRGVLLPKLTPSDFSHGSIRGRHVKTNVMPHIDSVFVLTADISNFYPTISHNRVYRLFAGKFQCSPDVAHICTRLCTHDYHLALGLVTSPAIADQVLLDIDRRLGAACVNAGLTYTRYVDDLSISGPFDLENSGFGSLVHRIMAEHGLAMNPSKNRFGRLARGEQITKIVIRRGHPDVRREYLAELERQLDDAINLGNGRQFDGPYYLRNQIAGRVQFACWINPGRRQKLVAKFRTVPWRQAAIEAANRGLVVAKKRLIKLQAEPKVTESIGTIHCAAPLPPNGGNL
ncbi:MAG: reverse transcriptase family protein [Pirellulaceae bacterium]